MSRPEKLVAVEALILGDFLGILVEILLDFEEGLTEAGEEMYLYFLLGFFSEQRETEFRVGEKKIELVAGILLFMNFISP